MTNEEYIRQGEARLERDLSRVKALVQYLPSERAKQVQEMLDGPVGSNFFTAPASTKRAYHYAFPGGLVAHSLNVVTHALTLQKHLAPDRWPVEKVVFCALFHDLGKAGDGKQPYYVRTEGSYLFDKGIFYDVNPRMTYMPSSDMGLYLLQRQGIVLEADEYLAIRLNDGPAAPENQMYAFREPDLSVLINMADNWAMRQEKAEARP